MITREEAESFARSWVQAWNDKDIAAVANHYSDDIIYHSPKLIEVIEHNGPFLVGKNALIEYWNAAIEGANSLYFEVNNIFLSSDAVTLCFVNHRGQDVAETFIFDENLKIKECIACYH
ncbi:YybH family protein [Hirschia maritima]|uniref:YybH family protein n=1 Tax=Hirschia maritima TaxID=1121961 RepID=UPI0003754FBA|nr:nuclear transport factor 2 family protein [Hirschia maritima]